jgi:predicted nuclease with RNAse H fold
MPAPAASTTLGIDLAAESANTGACLVRWSRAGARVEWACVGTTRAPLDNAALLPLARAADAVGVDAPLGWPRRFVAAVRGWSERGAWEEPWEPDARRALRLRATDRWIAALPGHRPPLSVSADSIGVCAMRASALLAELGPPEIDRVGGPVFEVYPAAALRCWEQDATGYKRDAAVRAALLSALAGDWLDLGGCEDALVASDHAFDALICALVARAAATGRTQPAPDELREDAVVEGWIHLPSGLPAELAG